MRRHSVADDLRDMQRREVAALTPEERVELALRLGAESFEVLAARQRLSPEVARRARDREKQKHRRRSGCLEALRS